MNRARKLAYVLSWIPPLALKLALAILGIPVVALAIAAYGHDSAAWPKLFAPWANREDSAAPIWFAGPRPSFGKSWTWFAIRNPVNGMRYWFDDREPRIYGWGPDSMEANDLLTHKVGVAERWAVAGPFAGYRRVWLESNGRYSEFWIGWKVGSSVPGMGFTIQYRRKREVGT